MSNGAAGCGYENANYGGNCGFLNREKTEDTEVFDCLKSHTPLETHHITRHPFRCGNCLKGKKH